MLFELSFELSTQWLILIISAFGAGLLNAIAGGGSFLTLPALIWAGASPVAAGVTSAVVVAPGYLGSIMGYQAELRTQPKNTLYADTISCTLGGILGSILLLITRDKIFASIVPGLLLFATILFITGSRINRYFSLKNQTISATYNTNENAHKNMHWVRPILLFFISVYGGYFNGGLGIILMAAYFMVGETDLHTINALKNFNSLILAFVSVLTFIAAGAVLWHYALPMMAAATAGGLAGVRLARRLPLSWVRGAVVLTGIAMTILLWQKA